MIKKFVKQGLLSVLKHKLVSQKVENLLGQVHWEESGIVNHLTHPMSLPANESEESLFNYLDSFSFPDENKVEMQNYLRHDFRRFLYTLALVPDADGKLLEIGANPYFTTLLLSKFRRYEMILTNYFEPTPSGGTLFEQWKVNPSGQKAVFPYYNVNVESSPLPWEDNSIDVVLFCEVLEHFVNDPLYALLSIHRVLKEGGTLVLSTPNVARLENIARLVVGENIYDPYSGYGPYGRHNREYNRQELERLLGYIGFQIEDVFTSDVHHNPAGQLVDLRKIIGLIENRKYDLGQYIFVRARKLPSSGGKTRKPSWLYRSYPEGELD